MDSFLLELQKPVKKVPRRTKHGEPGAQHQPPSNSERSSAVEHDTAAKMTSPAPPIPPSAPPVIPSMRTSPATHNAVDAVAEKLFGRTAGQARLTASTSSTMQPDASSANLWPSEHGSTGVDHQRLPSPLNGQPPPAQQTTNHANPPIMLPQAAPHFRLKGIIRR